MHTYDSIVDAARGLLGEVVETLGSVNTDYVVIGGWSPVLLNSTPIPHPGTRDVDILFARGAEAGELEESMKALQDHGYLHSAKHHFQMLRILKVRQYDFLFNVDFLHPYEHGAGGPLGDELFVDHIELDVPVSPHLAERYDAKSIATPHAGFILEDSRFVRSPVTATLPDGQDTTVEVPVVDEVGLIVTKSESIAVPKRPRDAFDIYLAVTQCRDYEALVESFKQLKKRHEGEFLCLDKIRHYIRFHGPMGFGRSVDSYLPEEYRDPSYSSFSDDPYAKPLLKLFEDVGLDVDF